MQCQQDVYLSYKKKKIPMVLGQVSDCNCMYVFILYTHYTILRLCRNGPVENSQLNIGKRKCASRRNNNNNNIV